MNIRNIIREFVVDEIENNDIMSFPVRCSQFLESDFFKSGNILYHGTNTAIATNNIQMMTYKKHNRKPIETAPYIDRWIEEVRIKTKHNNSVSRREAIFATTELDIATGYGSYTYIFVPCNGYKVTSNRNVSDFYGNIAEGLEEGINMLGEYDVDIDINTNFYKFKKSIEDLGEINFGNDLSGDLSIVHNLLLALEDYWIDSKNIIEEGVENLFAPINGFYFINEDYWEDLKMEIG